MNRDFIHKITEIVDQNLADENFGPEDLADKMGMSHSTLHRKLKEISGQTISQFIREIRLEKAKEILLNEEITISEIAYKVGFGSPTYFNKCFHEYFGVAPGEFKKLELGKEPEIEISKHKNKIQNTLLFIVASFLILISIFILINEKYTLINNNSGEKSVAVLPIKFHSENQDKQYLAEGALSAIVLHLSNIKDLHVISGTSVEQYRTKNKTVKIIGKELNVDYLVESSFYLKNDSARIILQLKNTSVEKDEWTKEYGWNINNVYSIQSEVAQTIAKQLNAVITPEEKQRIEKIADVNADAYDFYLHGNYEFLKYRLDNLNAEALNNAENFYKRAKDIDSTFAPLYAGLANIFWEKNYNKTYFADDFLTPILQLAETALKYDNQLAEAYLIRGRYYRETDEFDKALKDIKKAIEINPNYWEAYDALSEIYKWIPPDFVNAIKYGHKAISLNHGRELSRQYGSLGWSYACVGLMEQAKKYYKTSFDLGTDPDSSNYFYGLGTLEEYQGNYIKAQEYLDKAFTFDSTNILLLRRLGGNCMFLGNYQKSLYFYKKWTELTEQQGILDLGEVHRIALAYSKTGNKKEAEKYFNQQEQYCLESIEKNRDFAQTKRAHYDLAGVYAFKGEKEKAYKYLDEFNQIPAAPLWWVNHIKDDPLFEKIRNEERFRKIVEQVEQKYFAEHERVRKWLEENESQNETN